MTPETLLLDLLAGKKEKRNHSRLGKTDSQITR
jgi:hypothetical protein